MQKTCSGCQKLNTSSYKDFCKSCYQCKWVKTIPEKECVQCKNPFKDSGKRCGDCRYKDRRDIHKKKPCSQCGRIGFVKINIGKNLCNTCVRNNRDRDEPGYKERRMHKNFIFGRKYRGKPIDTPKRVKKGTWKTAEGYVLTFKKGHPNASSKGSINVHTLVMSEYLGRPLRKNETVHHKNGIRDDNRIENLELWHRGHPAGQRVEDKIEWAKNFLKEYGYEIISMI